jgi:apolipoprotein N-acyltransferase
MDLKRFVVWVIAPLCLGSAHLYASLLWPVGVFGFLLFLWLLHTARSVREVSWGSFAVGFLMMLFVVFWYWESYPIPALGDSFLLEQLFLLGIFWLYTALLLSVGSVSFGLFVYTYRAQSTLILFGAPVVWLCGELVSLFSYSLGTLGSGGLLGVNFGFALIGNIFSQMPFFIHGAVLYGAFGLSVLSVFFLTSIFVFIQNMQKQLPIILPLTGVFLVLLLVGTGYRESVSYVPLNTSVIAVETSFDKAFTAHAEADELREDALMEAFRAALLTDPDIIVFPEDSRVFDYFDNTDDFFAWIHTANSQFDGVVVDSGRFDTTREKAVLRGYTFDTATDVFTYTDKKFLVPQGEYISYVFSAILPIVLDPSVLLRVANRFGYVAGEEGTIGENAAHVPAILFCSESAVPFGAKLALKKHKGTIIVHPVSHAWFTKPWAMWRQLEVMLSQHAVWNRVPIVSAVNAGQSKAYLPNGSIDEGTVVGSGLYWGLTRFDL